MDYLKYKTNKFYNEYKNRKKVLNDTLNNAYTECSEKTAPTYASEAMRSRSVKTFMNNYFECKKGNYNTINNCDSNRFKENQETDSNYNNNKIIDNFSTKNSNFSNLIHSDYNNINNNNCQNFLSNHRGDYADNNIKAKYSQSVQNAVTCNNISRNNYSNNNNFEIARKKIDEYMEEKFTNKNNQRKTNDNGLNNSTGNNNFNNRYYDNQDPNQTGRNKNQRQQEKCLHEVQNKKNNNNNFSNINNNDDSNHDNYKNTKSKINNNNKDTNKINFTEKLNNSCDSTNNLESSENTDFADKIYKSGKLLEKSKFLTSLNLNLEMDFKDLYNQQGREVMKYLQPILEKLKKKEAILEELTGKAREYISEYKKNGEILNKRIEKYKLKKVRLNKLVENVGNLRREAKDKEYENTEKEKFLLSLEWEINQKIDEFEEDKKKFNKFVESKSKEILTKAEAFKSESLNAKNLTGIFQQKEFEITEKFKTFEKKEAEFQKNLQKFESEIYDYDIKKREYDLAKEEFDLYSNDVLNKYEEIKNFKNNFDEQSKKLQQYELILNERNMENIEKERKVALIQSDIENKNKESGIKQLIIAEREKEIENMKILLQEKLVEYNSKVDNAQRVQERLKEKENILTFKSDIENEIDLKLSGLELNETINKKKIAVQHRMLNEEIAKRLTIGKLAKKIVKGSAENSNNTSANNKSNFSKLMTIIKGNK